MEVADLKESIILTIDTGINNLISQMDVGDRQLIQIDPGITLLNANYTQRAVQSPIKKVHRITEMYAKYNEIIDKIGEEHPIAARQLRERMSVDTQPLNLDSITTINNEIKGILDKISEPNLVILDDLFDEVDGNMLSIDRQLEQLIQSAQGYGTPRARNRNTSPPPGPRKGGSKKRKSKKRKSKKRKSKKRKSKKRKSKKRKSKKRKSMKK